MGIVELLGLASSISFLAGWRMYLCVFATGLAMHFGVIDLPENLKTLDALANPWVIGVAGVGLTAEFFADKIAWLDSFWDSVHTAIRPIGGALLAMAIVDSSDPTWQIVSLLLGGSAALVSHSAKAGTRAVVNASPEPFSNVAVSVGEDVVTTGLLYLVLNDPMLSGIVAVILFAVAIFAILTVRRILKKLFGSGEKPKEIAGG